MFAARRLLVKVLVLPNAAFANTVDNGPVMDCSGKQNTWEVNCIFRYRVVKLSVLEVRSR